MRCAQSPHPGCDCVRLGGGYNKGMNGCNILLIQADQLRFDCLGVNGHRLVRTPNLDRLAAQGVNFTQAYCPIPVCTPARASLLSGRWPTQHQGITNRDSEAACPLRTDVPTFSGALAAAGYRLGCVGKWGVHPHKGPLEFGFHDWMDGREYSAWRKAQGLPGKPNANGWLGETDEKITAAQSQLAWGADRTLELLERYAKQAGQRKFFLRWDPPEPHLPNVVPEPYASMYRPGDIQPWASFADGLENKPYIQRQQRRTWEIDGWDWSRWAPTVARYLGEVSLLDAQVGRILDRLAELGLAESTLVAFTADHGDLCGGHGMIDKHYVMYDDVVRVPLFLRGPGVTGAPGQCAAFVCNGLDLAATFCAAAGVDRPEGFVGQNLLDLAQGRAKERPDIFGMYFGAQFGLYSQRMVRDRKWKYVWNATDCDELYDLESDPGERRNRAGDAACAGELKRLRGRMIQWMQEAQDPLLNGWVRGQLEGGRKG
ncbi:MAG: sulfatase-like hydrolase/transferase [Phycisphaeraceae bacterium]|nr:sulfatase-like hydrolase/transferase [Phycisphaeraceae bacterium]